MLALVVAQPAAGVFWCATCQRWPVQPQGGGTALLTVPPQPAWNRALRGQGSLLPWFNCYGAPAPEAPLSSRSPCASAAQREAAVLRRDPSAPHGARVCHAPGVSRISARDPLTAETGAWGAPCLALRYSSYSSGALTEPSGEQPQP